MGNFISFQKMYTFDKKNNDHTEMDLSGKILLVISDSHSE